MGYSGLNDRFSICNSLYSASIYSNRINKVKEYLKYSKIALAPEHLLYYSIKKSDSKLQLMNIKAQRVRANNFIVEENFNTNEDFIRLKKK